MLESHYLSCARIYADAAGTSHFEDYQLKVESTDFAPPAPPIQISEFKPAARYGFACAAAGWFGDWHPAPRRQMAIVLAGELEVKVSSGEVRRLEPGSAVLLEDVTGKGHTTRVLGSTDAVLVFVQLD